MCDAVYCTYTVMPTLEHWDKSVCDAVYCTYIHGNAQIRAFGKFVFDAVYCNYTVVPRLEPMASLCVTLYTAITR